MHEPAKSGGSYNEGSAQAPTPYGLFRKTGTRTRNPSDAANTELLLSSNPSKYHTQSLAEGSPCTDASDTIPEQSRSFHPSPDHLEAEPEMLLQTDTRPISHEQLVVEVKGIYAGLVMVEAKCIDIDERQSAAAQEKDMNKRVNLKNDQWQSLIALHKQLLHEHHDFFLASQHPSASPASSRLAAKYSMPARMWRHGIHAFLEVLRHRLTESLEHMLAFIYIAYSMMALLYETVTDFEDTWIECLGDLGRYRMAIEDDEPKDREVWSNVARFWYNHAADKSPSVGRLYHHLAILARPYTLEQLSLYTRSLTCVIPFASAKASIKTLFNPVLQGSYNLHHWSSSLGTAFTLDLANQFNAIAYDPGAKCLTQKLNNNLEPESGFPEPGRKPPPLDFLLRGQLYSQFYLSENWTRDITIDDDEWCDEVLSTAQQRIESILWLVGQNTSASWRVPYLPVRQYTALILNGLRRWTSALNSLLVIPFIASCLPGVRGSPIGNPDEANEPSSIAHLVLLLAGALYVGSAVAVLATARSLATKKGPIRVWVCMMGISAYAWWAVRNDATASASLSITDLGVWAISAFQYGNTTFQEFRIPERVFMLTVLGAVILDMAIVSFMTPNGAAISQSDLLSLSLPAMSLSLAVTANLFGCFRGQPPSPLPSHEMEVGVSVSRSDPHIESHLEQRLNIPYLDTSRLRLLGSPLHEDSTRIWEADD